MVSNPQNHPDTEERVRASQALALRVGGATYAAIADQLDYADESGARKAVDRLLSRVEYEGAAELRQLEGKRLDAVMFGHFTKAARGDTDAARIVLGVIDRRCRLFGLNAPARVSLVDDSPMDFAQRAAEIITTLRPDALRTLMGGVPRQALAGTDDQTEPPGDDWLPEPDSAVVGPHSPSEGWSNIGGAIPSAPEAEPDPVMSAVAQRRGAVIPEPADADEFAGIPEHVLALAANAARGAADPDVAVADVLARHGYGDGAR